MLTLPNEKNSKHLQMTKQMLTKNCNWFLKGRKHCGKRRKCWSLVFSPFPTMFSEGYLLRVTNQCHCQNVSDMIPQSN